MIAADKALVKKQPRKRLLRQASHAGVDVGAQLPANDDAAHIPCLRQFGSDENVVGTGHDLPFLSGHDQLRQLQSGRAAVQKDRLSVPDTAIGLPGDGLLLFHLPVFIFLMGKFPQGAVGAHRAAPGPFQHPFLLHSRKQLPDRNFRKSEGFTQF